MTSRRHTYSKIDPKRPLFVFDLDETLIQTQEIEKVPRSGTESDTTYEGMRFPPHSRGFVYMSEYSEYVRVNLVHVRPYADDLLRACFEHGNVAFWSSGDIDYVRYVTNKLLEMCEKTPADACFVWGRHPTNNSRHAFVDAFLSRDVPNEEGAPNKDYRKSARVVFRECTSAPRGRTFILDNLPNHMVGDARVNHVYVPPYTYLNYHDIVAKRLAEVVGRRKARVRHSDLLAIERMSPTNNGVLTSDGYLDNLEMVPRMELAELKAGTEIVFVDPAIDRVDVGSVVRATNAHVWVRRIDYRGHTMNGLRNTLERNGTELGRLVVTHVPLHAIRGHLDDLKDTYGLRGLVRLWKKMAARRPRSARQRKRKTKTNTRGATKTKTKLRLRRSVRSVKKQRRRKRSAKAPKP